MQTSDEEQGSNMHFEGGLSGRESKEIRVYCDGLMEEREDEIAEIVKASEENVSIRLV